MGKRRRLVFAAVGVAVAVGAIGALAWWRGDDGEAFDGEDWVDFSPATIGAMQAMLAVDDALVPMWPTEIADAPTDSSFQNMGVRRSIKRHYLRMLKEDLERGHDEIDTRFAAEMPEDFKDLKFIRVAMIHPRNHNYSGFHVVLANDTAIRGWGPDFPDGSTIVKLIYPAFRDASENLFQGEIVASFVFHKDRERYPAEFDHWGFEVYDYYNRARMVTSREWARWCYDCHSQSPTDVVWSPRALPDLELPPTEPKPARYFPARPPRIQQVP